MKSLYKSFNFETILNQIPKWTWKELYYAIKNGIINCNDVIYYAKYSVNESSNDLVYQLCLLEESEKIYNILKRLSEFELEETEYIKNKWIFAILLYFYKNKNKYSDPLSMVEEVYVDFDYPDSIRNLIRYMPVDDDSKYGDAEIYIKWKKYIINNFKLYAE